MPFQQASRPSLPRRICDAQAATFGPDKAEAGERQTAWQLRSVQEATDFMPEADRQLMQRQLTDLLRGVLHPDTGKRWTAQHVVALDWLRVAAAAPLPQCPRIIAIGI